MNVNDAPDHLDPEILDPETSDSETLDPETQDPETQEIAAVALPVIAVVGRPNVGKSTLVNRVIGRREAVVEDVPGVTRDRVAYDAEWSGRSFTVVDTGGWDADATGRAARIAAQAEIAVEAADVVVFVVDGTVGATDSDEAVCRVLRRARKPVILAVNKVDGQSGEADAASLWSLGLGEPYPVSALHGRGSGDLLQAMVDALPETTTVDAAPTGGPRRVALLGKPNVGKSSLLNRLVGSDRALVDPVAGTTVDPVDELVDLGGQKFRFIDTAGIRRKVASASGTEYFASLRTHAALERAEVAAVLLDAGQPLTEQDQRIITSVVDAGRALVLVFNKWDLVDEDRRGLLEREIDRDLARVEWAPRVNLAALTGRRVDRLLPALNTAIESWERRIPTGRLNAFLGELVAATPPPVRGGKQPKILFGTQASTRPPTFVLFTTGFLEAGYRRFIVRRLREDFDFTGTPLHVSVRVRERRAR